MKQINIGIVISGMARLKSCLGAGVQRHLSRGGIVSA